MSEIAYVTGDATSPQGEGNKIIVHICNDVKKWGAGFVLALSKKWYAPEIAFRKMSDGILGNVQFVRVENDIIVANMIAQHDTVKGKDGLPPIRYDALLSCLMKVNQMALETGSSIHMPRIGAGLAGGDWSVIEGIIKDTMSVPVTVYDLPKKDELGMPIIKK